MEKQGNNPKLGLLFPEPKDKLQEKAHNEQSSLCNLHWMRDTSYMYSDDKNYFCPAALAWNRTGAGGKSWFRVTDALSLQFLLFHV